MVFVLRLRTSQGTKRLLFSEGKTATLKDLLLQVKDLTGIPTEKQQLLFQDPKTRKKKDVALLPSLDVTLTQMGLSKGDVLHLIEDSTTRAKPNPKPKPKKEQVEASSSSSTKAKKGPHMTFKAFTKISGLPVIPDYSAHLYNRTHQRTTSSYAPNVHWKLQRYRHTDIFSFSSPTILEKFYKNSIPEIKSKLSRMGIMFGRYVEDINPLEHQNTTDNLNREKKWDFDANGVRADVFAIYEPPQEAMETGARFITDPNQDTVRGMAEAMGLEPVGLIIAKAKADLDPKGFQTYITGKELVSLARLQNVFVDDNNFSRFACVVLEHSEMIEPVGLAASDIACALVKDDLLDVYKGKPFMLTCKTPEGCDPSDMPQFHIPKDNDQSGGTMQAKEKIPPGKPFPIDFLTVKVIVSQSRGGFSLFKHSDFPAFGSLRQLKTYMQRHQHEGFNAKFSDFNLLLSLPELFGDKDAETAIDIAQHIGAGEEFSEGLSKKLNDWFIQKQLF